MTGASKILTVSYGTFSCTLEGFDDPFTTMRHIAEYFRDLAAEDRYFGCEPPVPDAAMLQRIAETSGRKRVATEMQDGGLVLRQSPDDLTTAPDSAPAAPEPETPRPARLGVVEGSGSISDKIERIRRVSEGRDWPASGQIRALFPDGTDLAEEVTGTAADPAADAPGAEQIAEQIAQDETGIAEATLLDIAAAPEADISAPDTESAAPEEVLPAVSEETTRALSPEPDLPQDAGNAAPAGARGEADPLDSAAPQGETPPAAALTEAEEAASDAPAPTAQEMAPAAQAKPALHDAGPEDVAASEPAPAPVTPPEAVDTPPAPQVPDTAELATAPAEDDSAATDQAEQTRRMARRARARLAKISQQQVTPAPQESAPAPAAEPAAATTAADTPGPAADHALEATLAALQNDEDAAEEALRAALDTSQPFGDDAPAATDAPVPAEAPVAARQVAAGDAANDPAEPAPNPFGTVDSASDGPALERLMQTVDSKLSGSEQVRKLNAFQQLKAAVAATFADRQSRGSEPAVAPAPRERSEAYRTDLREVTQTRRPSRADTGSGFTANTPRPAPLVLVSEQRVDRSGGGAPDSPPAAGRVRPRRVLRDNTEAAGRRIGDQVPRAGDNFRDFAERIGATGLPDLLEAAAAYTAHIEGRSRFSRAQVMSKLAEIDTPDGTAYSREEGLRSFGKLLRQGRIRRVQDGQFVIADTSRFAQDTRTATG